jgi:hypothetical protein
MIRVVHPGSPDPDCLPIPDPRGSKRHRILDPDPQHWYERSVSNVAELHGLACDVRVPAPRHRGHLLHHARAGRSGLSTFFIVFSHFYDATVALCWIRRSLYKKFYTRIQSFPMNHRVVK